MSETVHLVEESWERAGTHHRAVFDEFDDAVAYAKDRAVEQTDSGRDDLHESTGVQADLCISSGVMCWLVWSLSVNEPEPDS